MKPIKIIRSKLQKTVLQLKDGEIAWVPYDAMWVDFDDTCHIDIYASTSRKRTKGFLLKIKKVPEGVIAYYKNSRHIWEYNDAENDTKYHYPEWAIDVVAISDEYYEKRKVSDVAEKLQKDIDYYETKIIELQDHFRHDSGFDNQMLLAKATTYSNKLAELKKEQELRIKQKKSG